MGFSEKYGPWALIAGASEGTGRSFAHHVAAEGVNCVLVARRNGPLVELAEDIRAKHRVECITASIDLSANDATAQMSAAVGNKEIGLLICNAGGDPNVSTFFNNEIANWDELVMRNVLTVMRCCHHFAKPMMARKRGGIIIVGSGACYGGIPGITTYCATKAFDLCLGEGLWAELRPYGVDVLNLILGVTDTPAFRKNQERRGQPLPTNMASPDDVAVVGLARLPHGPVHNWALEDNEVGYAVTSAATRRERILAIAKAFKAS